MIGFIDRWAEKYVSQKRGIEPGDFVSLVIVKQRAIMGDRWRDLVEAQFDGARRDLEETIELVRDLIIDINRQAYGDDHTR